MFGIRQLPTVKDVQLVAILPNLKEAAMSRTPIQCCFCHTEGQTVLEEWEHHRILLLCIFPHFRKGPKIYACRKCIRLRWKISDKDFSIEVLEITREKPASSTPKSATSRRRSKSR